jgi:hypothetical protein
MVENGIENQKSPAAIVTDSSSSATTLALPVDCFPLTHQVAGHFFGKGKTKLGMNRIHDRTDCLNKNCF